MRGCSKDGGPIIVEGSCGSVKGAGPDGVIISTNGQPHPSATGVVWIPGQSRGRRRDSCALYPVIHKGSGPIKGAGPDRVIVSTNDHLQSSTAGIVWIPGQGGGFWSDSSYLCPVIHKGSGSIKGAGPDRIVHSTNDHLQPSTAGIVWIPGYRRTGGGCSRDLGPTTKYTGGVEGTGINQIVHTADHYLEVVGRLVPGQSRFRRCCPREECPGEAKYSLLSRLCRDHSDLRVGGAGRTSGRNGSIGLVQLQVQKTVMGGIQDPEAVLLGLYFQVREGRAIDHHGIQKCFRPPGHIGRAGHAWRLRGSITAVEGW